MAANSVNNPLSYTHRLQLEELEAPRPLYLQRLLPRLEQPLPNPTHEAYYHICLLCDASGEIDEPLLSGANFSPSQFELFEDLRKLAGDYTDAPRFTENPYKNIPGYIKAAVLPSMGWISSLVTSGAPLELAPDTSQVPSSQAINPSATGSDSLVQLTPADPTLKRSPEKRLRQIQRFQRPEFRKRVKAYVDTLPTGFQRRTYASERVREVTGDRLNEQLRLPAFAFSINTGLTRMRPPSNKAAVKYWIKDLVATTAETLLHLCHPSTTSYTYGVSPEDGASKHTSDLFWHCLPQSSSKPGVKRLVFEVDTPWTLDAITFDRFVQLDCLPAREQLVKIAQPTQENKPTQSSRCKPNVPNLSKVQTMWAQIHDRCVTQGTYFFVFTSYEYWVFGVFSVDYSYARVTDPIPYDSKEPTVLACLMYWTQSAMFVSGLQEVPWVSDQQKSLTRTSSTMLKDVLGLSLQAAKSILSAI